MKKGYNVAKRGLLIWEFFDKSNNIVKRLKYFTNDDQLISLNAKTGQIPIKSFGKNGIIKIGSSPIPPVIIKNH